MQKSELGNCQYKRRGVPYFSIGEKDNKASQAFKLSISRLKYLYTLHVERRAGGDFKNKALFDFPMNIEPIWRNVYTSENWLFLMKSFNHKVL